MTSTTIKLLRLFNLELPSATPVSEVLQPPLKVTTTTPRKDKIEEASAHLTRATLRMLAAQRQATAE